MVVCYVVGCNTGYKGKPGHVFKIPRKASAAIRKAWEENIPKRTDKPWNFNTCKICDRHFEEKFIIKKNQVIFQGEVMAEANRIHYKLSDDAVPTLFKNSKIPSYMQKATTPRKPPTQRHVPLKSYPQSTKISKHGNSTEAPTELFDVDQQTSSFTKFLEGLKLEKLPELWLLSSNDNEAVLSKLRQSLSTEVTPLFVVERRVVLSELHPPKTYVYSSEICILEAEYTNENWKEIVKIVDSFKLCPGLQNFRAVLECEGGIRRDSSWHSIACQILSENGTCMECLKLKPNLVKLGEMICALNKQAKAPILKASTSKFQNLNQKVRRLSKKVVSLKGLLKNLRSDLKRLKPEKLSLAIEKENNLPQEMKAAMMAAAQRAKAKSSKGNRYANDWLLQCLLIRITSPKAYRFLRNNNILALPHPNHLSKLMRGIPCQFGFNDFVFNALQRQYKNRDKRERQFMLVFDEIKIRESVEFDKLRGEFTGFNDYAEFNEEFRSKGNSTTWLADHALVIMCRNLMNKVVQPIASFASKGAAPGHILAKIIISAIMKLEAANCEVAGVVCDGASTNKSLWKLLGISGTSSGIVNFVMNPSDNTRKVFFLCDVPHIIKCIRNNFQKYKVVQFEGKDINWGCYQAVFDIEKSKDKKLAPRLTEAHLKTGPFQKMVVFYATQIFSKSVANAICFYRTIAKDKIFKDSENTECFTRKIDQVFDILNAKQIYEGIKSGSDETRILKSFLESVSLTNNTFASELTMQSLRVTLQSSLDLIEYLCDHAGFEYVLTSKFNQDCLERFFGILRLVGGDDNHPTVSTFTHLFRILSMYNPVKHQLKGNIRSTEDEEVLVSVANLRFMAKQRKDSTAQVQNLREIAIKERMVLDTAFELEQSLTKDLTTEDYIVYYLCGYISHKALKFSSCVKCQLSLKTEQRTNSAKAWIDLKSLGGLSYPSDNLFQLINLVIEPVVMSNLNDLSSHEDILSKCIESLPLFNVDGIGCGEKHSESFVVKIILHYIITRCYFHKREMNRAKGNPVIITKICLSKASLPKMYFPIHKWQVLLKLNVIIN